MYGFTAAQVLVVGIALGLPFLVAMSFFMRRD